MALDYDTTDTGIFYRGGRLVSAIYTRDDYYSNIQGELEAIVEPFENADLTDQVIDLYPAYEREKDQVTELRQKLADKWDAIFSERTVLEELDLLTFIPDTFFPALFLRMITDSESIKTNAVTLGSSTVSGTGTGTAVTTLRLDGVTPPVINGPAIAGYATKGPTYSQLTGIESFTFTCTRDRYNGATAGSEEFSWQGSIEGDKWGEDVLQGSGDGPRLVCVGGEDFPINGDMEDFTTTANLPDSWSKVAGTVGTHIAQDTVTFYRGASALKFVGDGSQATISINQAITQTDLIPLKSYLLSCRVKCSVNAPAAGNFELYLSGTGYSPHSSETIGLAPGSLTTSWQLLTVPVVIPASYPTDMALVCRVTGTLTNAVSLFIDEIRLLPLEYHGGFAAQVLPGQTDWLVGDKITVTVSTAKTGRFQHFMRRQYGCQLPSSATPTIDGVALAGE